jgi:arabinofuranosyltransferase
MKQTTNSSLDKENRLPILALLTFYALLVVRNAWISDDAFITFRSVENFLAGYGMGFNPFVRVQSFTHPLWMLLLSFVYFIEQIFVPHAPNALTYITIFLSVGFSVAALYILLTRIARPGMLSFTLPILILTLTGTFIDFSTSGLENPLTHLLLVLFMLAFLTFPGNLLVLSFLASLIALNRIDTLLLVTPALAFAWWIFPLRRAGFLQLIIGFLPMILWTLFSLLYFGFPFPNTAYAKLNTDINSALLMQQGLDYFLNSVNWEPLTFFTILLAGFCLYLNREIKSLFLYAGVVLYLLYIVRIGGDFMSGRFLTAPLLMSVAIISYIEIPRRSLLTALLVTILLGVFSARSPLWGSNMVLQFPTYPIGDRNQISDQRLYYFGNPTEQQFNSFVENGFKDAGLGSPFAGEKWYFTKTRNVMVIDALGRIGYEKGPNIYIIDPLALADPLLARLPVQKKYWQIGHFRRDLPEGYIETLETGEVMIADPDLAAYYEKLQVIIQGPIWDTARMGEIWKFNTGQYDYLVDRYISRQPQVQP